MITLTAYQVALFAALLAVLTAIITVALEEFLQWRYERKHEIFDKENL